MVKEIIILNIMNNKTAETSVRYDKNCVNIVKICNDSFQKGHLVAPFEERKFCRLSDINEKYSLNLIKNTSDLDYLKNTNAFLTRVVAKDDSYITLELAEKDIPYFVK